MHCYYRVIEALSLHRDKCPSPIIHDVFLFPKSFRGFWLNANNSECSVIFFTNDVFNPNWVLKRKGYCQFGNKVTKFMTMAQPFLYFFLTQGILERVKRSEREVTNSIVHSLPFHSPLTSPKFLRLIR